MIVLFEPGGKYRIPIGFETSDREKATMSKRKWFPYAKGGDFQRWAGNLDSVVNWADYGRELQTTLTGCRHRHRAHNFNLDRIFKPGIAWTVVTSGALSFRIVGPGCLSMQPLVYVNRKMMITFLPCLTPRLQLWCYKG